ncbi:MAG: MATE family efflux transporter [Ruminococcaceae bacterium]|nr:MATE family efflux transporter [Oscillospiraceae bacterium]
MNFNRLQRVAFGRPDKLFGISTHLWPRLPAENTAPRGLLKEGIHVAAPTVTSPPRPPAALGAARWTNKELKRLLVPLVIEQLLTIAIGVVDTVMVTSVGESAVSGVSLVDSINLLLITLLTALANGGVVVVSQYLGRGDNENASTAARQLVYIVTMVSVTIMILMFFLRMQILRLIFGHIAPDVMANAETYFRISSFCYPFVALYNAGAAIFRSMGNSRIGMYITLAINIIHLIGNFVLIYGLQWGVAGAAVSTLTSRAIAAVTILVLLYRNTTSPVSLRGLLRVRLVPAMLWRILRIGLPNGLENSLFQVGKLMVARIISSFGTAAIAGNAIGNMVVNVPNMAGNAFALGMLIVAGHCMGAGDIEGTRRMVKKVDRIALVVLTAMSVVILLIMQPLLGAFDLSDGASQVAREILLIYCIGTPLFWVPAFVLPCALRAAGDVRYNMVTSLGSMWLFRVGGAYLAAYTLGLGVVGVWVAVVADWAVRSLLYWLRWRSGRWETKKVIE